MAMFLDLRSAIWGDVRFDWLAKKTKEHKWLSMMRVLRIWSYCCEKETDRLPEKLVLMHADWSTSDFVSFLIDVDLAVVSGDGISFPDLSQTLSKFLSDKENKRKGAETKWAKKRDADAMQNDAGAMHLHAPAMQNDAEQCTPMQEQCSAMPYPNPIPSPNPKPEIEDYPTYSPPSGEKRLATKKALRERAIREMDELVGAIHRDIKGEDLGELMSTEGRAWMVRRFGSWEQFHREYSEAWKAQKDLSFVKGLRLSLACHFFDLANLPKTKRDERNGGQGIPLPPDGEKLDLNAN